MVNLVKLSPQKQKFENVFSYPFLWKVGLTHIHGLRPNFEIGSLVGRN